MEERLSDSRSECPLCTLAQSQRAPFFFFGPSGWLGIGAAGIKSFFMINSFFSSPLDSLFLLSMPGYPRCRSL